MPPSTPEPNVLCALCSRPWAQHRTTIATRRPDRVRYCPGYGAQRWSPAPVPERVVVDTETSWTQGWLARMPTARPMADMGREMRLASAYGMSVQQVPVPFPDDRVDAAVYGFSGIALSNAPPGERERWDRWDRWDRASSGDILLDMEAAARVMRTATPSAPVTAAWTVYSSAEIVAAQRASQGTVTGRLSMSGRGLPTNEAIAAKQPIEPEPFVTSDGPRAAPELDSAPRAEAPAADIHGERYAAIELD